MDFASPAASIAGEQTARQGTGKTFATWTFNKAKNPFVTRWRGSWSTTADRSVDAALGYREDHLPSAVGEGLAS